MRAKDVNYNLWTINEHIGKVESEVSQIPHYTYTSPPERYQTTVKPKSEKKIWIQLS